MPIEIERKFLVNDVTFIKQSFKKSHIKQGFLNTNKHRTVRIRIENNKGFLTVKGITNKNGMSRFEWEKEISITDAERLLLLCEDIPIEKNRHYVKNKQFILEIDVFLGQNKGLIVAEIELNSESDVFHKPEWLGEEVTGNIKYYNSCLSKKPFSSWKKNLG
jgi:adenylate cyclase